MKIRWDIVGLIVFSKVCIFLLIFLAYQIFPFNKLYYSPNFIYPPGESASLKTAYKTWDAQHFLYISEKGYHKGNDSNAFSPLYPLLIFVLDSVTKNSFTAGLLISNVCSLVAFYLFFIVTSQWFDEKIARKSLIFLLCFPTSFFFSLIYSESLFFLLIMLFFHFLTQKKIMIASLIALLIPLTRLVGIFIIFPFLSWYIFSFSQLTLYHEVKDVAQKFLKKEALALTFPFLGLGVVIIVMYLLTGDFFAQFDAQKQFISHYSLFSLLNPFSFIRSFFAFPLVLGGFTNSLFDRIFFVGFVMLLFFMLKRVNIILFIFSVAFGILPVLSGSFMSYMRYLVIIFPIYIALAKMTNEKKYAFLQFPLLFTFTILQTLFIIMHSLNYWVA